MNGFCSSLKTKVKKWFDVCKSHLTATVFQYYGYYSYFTTKVVTQTVKRKMVSSIFLASGDFECFMVQPFWVSPLFHVGVRFSGHLLELEAKLFLIIWRNSLLNVFGHTFFFIRFHS